MNKTRLNASRTRRNRRQAIVIPAANKDQNAKGFRRFAKALRTGCPCVKQAYSAADCEIWEGDCRNLLARLPDKSVDMIITDPPYGLNYNDGDLAEKWEKLFGGNPSNMKRRPHANDSKEIATALLINLFADAVRILRGSGCCCCCCCCGGGGPKPLFADWALWIDRFIGLKQAVVWNKPGLGMGMHYRRNYEFMLVGQMKGKGKWNGGNKTPNIVTIQKIIPSKKQHPTQKPVALFEHFIRLHTDPGDVVLDPFMGSGTAAIAARNLGRKFIGFEIDPQWVRMAVKRLKDNHETHSHVTS